MECSQLSESSEGTESSEEESCESEQEIQVKEYIARVKAYVRRCKTMELKFKRYKQHYYKLRISVNETKTVQLMNSDDVLFKDLMKTRKETMEAECHKAAELLRKSKEFIARMEDMEKTTIDNTKDSFMLHEVNSLRRRLLTQLKAVEDEYTESMVKQKLWLLRLEDKKKESLADAQAADDDDRPRTSFPKSSEQRHRPVRKNQPKIVYGLSEKRLAEELEKIRRITYTEKYRKMYYSYNYDELLGAS